MSSNTTVSLTLQIKGNAGQELKRISDQQVKSTTQINQQWTQIGSTQAKFVNTARAGTQATINTARASDQVLRTNRILEGVLRQQSIQSKLLSQNLRQQANSTQQMANWMKQVEQSSKRTQQNTQQTSSLWQKGTAAAGAATASGMYLTNVMQKPRDYDQQLTYATLTATSGQGLSAKERYARRELLNSYIKGAVRSGGGTRDDALTAASELIASGKYELDTVEVPLKTSVKTAFATGATANDAATLTIRMSDFGVTDLQKGHDIAVKGDQFGAFSYRDQAKWLAQQMAAAKLIGYSGEKGLVELVAMNQVAMSTAATPDEAGNNVVNLLAKLSSREFSKSVADAVTVKTGDPTKSDGKKKPKQLFDWSTYAIQQRDQGVNGVEAFVKLLERQLAGNKQYQALQVKAKSAKTSEAKKAALDDMSNIAMGSELGEIIADRQALMAALSVVYQKDRVNMMQKELPNAGGTVEADSAVVQQADWAKEIAMNQEKLFAQSKLYDSLSESLGSAKENVTNWARGNEELASSAYAASVALTALALGAGAATILGGGGKVKGLATAGIAGASRLLPWAQKAAVPLTIAAGAYGLYDIATNDSLSQYQKNIKQAGIVGGTGGAIGGGMAGAAIGSMIFPGVGTVIGGLLGGAAGYLAGEKGGEAFGEFFNEQNGIMEQQNQLIEQQNQYTQQLLGKVDSLITATNNIKPTVNFGGGSLLDMMSNHAATQEKRHGAITVPFLPPSM